MDGHQGRDASDIPLVVPASLGFNSFRVEKIGGNSKTGNRVTFWRRARFRQSPATKKKLMVTTSTKCPRLLRRFIEKFLK